MKFFKTNQLNIILYARNNEPECYFYKDYLPFDLFKNIYFISKRYCLEFEFDKIQEKNKCFRN